MLVSETTIEKDGQTGAAHGASSACHMGEADAGSCRSETSLFTLTDVSFRVRDRTLLQPLTLSVPKGRVCGLIGHNGSGKSTLLKLLARQYVPSAGEIRFDGRSLQRWSNRALARRLAYLPQQQPPANGMTVRELVSLGRYPWHGALGRFSHQDREKVDEALSLTALHDYAGRQVDQLSGGERQRAWIAMLVAQDSECLLLDEPISALDIGHQIEVLDLVRTLSTRNRLGVMVVLHDVNMAARFCNDLIALKGGALLAKGRATDLIDADTLGSIYGVKMGTLPHPAGGSPISFAY